MHICETQREINPHNLTNTSKVDLNHAQGRISTKTSNCSCGPKVVEFTPIFGPAMLLFGLSYTALITCMGR